MIPISTVKFDEETEQGVLAVLRSGMIAQGPRVAELETLFAQISGVKHAIAVNNGTTALVAALKMLRLPAGTTLVTSPFTFVATLNAALEAGFRVKFADVELTSFNMAPASLALCATPDVSAVMPVHLYGQCADMTQISALARKHDWALIEDAAQAHGARHQGRAAGSFGIGCFSFYATKNITTGEGGIITTDDDEIADRLRVFRNQGMRQRYQYEMAGTNYRMTDIQAAIGVPQLRRIGAINQARQMNAARLSSLLADVDDIVTPTVEVGNEHVWHQYTIRVLGSGRRSRDEVLESLGHAGIGSGVYYPRLAHDYECFKGHPSIDISETPVATQLTREVISLPVHQYLTEEDLGTIASAVKTALL